MRYGPARERRAGGSQGRGAHDPGRPGAFGAAPACTARAEPAGGAAHAGDRERAGGPEPGRGRPARRHGAAGAARRGRPLQRGGYRGAARPAQAGTAPAAERGRAGRPGGAGLHRTRPGAGRHGGVDARRPVRLARGPLRQGVPPVEPVTGAQAPGPVAAEDPARPSGGRPEGAGALPKKGLRDALRAAAEAHPGERIALWFMDEASVGQKGRLCRRWRVRGRRPPGRCDRRSESACIFAAVEPATGADVALVLPEATTAAMNLVLATFAAGLAEGVHAALALDGAGWHGARGLIIPANVTLVPLPPYSPELNPVERVWLYLRERFLSLRVFADYRAVVDACCAAWNRLVAEPGRLRPLCDQPWIRKVSS